MEGVVVKPLVVAPDERGFFMGMLSADEPLFERFGQVYLTGCQRGVAKAWHHHREQVDHYVCVWGRALVVLCDLREGSPTRGETREFVLEAPPDRTSRPILLRIPPLVVHGFTPLDCDEARIVNIPSHPYRPDAPDKVRLPWNSAEVPYRWPDFVTAGG